MNINNLNFLPVTNQLQSLKELNFKVGQKVIGKIVNLSDDEALLEIAGRPLQAKIEGNAPPAGSTQTFLVNTDEQGRIVLKVLPNPAEVSGENLKENTEINNDPEASFLQKSILSALTKAGLPPTSENVEKVTQNLQDFQAKYQQTLNPKVFTFLMAHKLPVTPATVLASWVNQDPEVREMLWDKLQDSLPTQEAAGFQEKMVMNMQSNSIEIADKLKSLVGLKLPGFMDKLSALFQQSKTSAQLSEESPANAATVAKILSPDELKATLLSAIKTDIGPALNQEQPATTTLNQGPQADPKANDSKQQVTTGIKNSISSQMKPDSAVTANKSQTNITAGVKVILTEKTTEPNQEKIQSLLDQNIGINKAILKETAVNGSSNLIPLLVNDSQANIRECLVHWKEEKSSNSSSINDQVVYMSIPTENLGDIHLALRIGSNATKINLRVDSEDVRRYFMQHATELKDEISKDNNNTLISVNLKDNEKLPTAIQGVDLWM